MKWFRDLRLRSKQLVALGSVVVVVVIGTTFTLRAIMEMQDAFDRQQQADQLELLGISAVGTLSDARNDLTTYLLTGDPEALTALENSVTEFNSVLTDLREVSAGDPELDTAWDEVEQQLDVYRTSVVEPAIDLRSAAAPGDPIPPELVELVSQPASLTYYADLSAALETAIAGITQADIATSDETSETASAVTRWTLIATVLTIAMCAFIAILLSRLLATPLQRLAAAFRRVASGDLDVDSSGITGKDEIGQLGAAFDSVVAVLQVTGRQASSVGKGRVNDKALDTTLPGDLGDSIAGMVVYLREIAEVAESLSQGDLTRDVRLRSEADTLGWALRRMTISLRTTVENVRRVTDQVHEGANALAAGADSSADLAGEVADTVQTINASLAEQTNATTDVAMAIADISAEVVATADAVQAAVDAASRAGERGREGEDHLRRLSAAMTRIEAGNSQAVARFEELDRASTKVDEMVDVIRSVAEQTKYLALNASISAAQASEGGRGFALVAAEINALSDQTAESSKKVAEIVEQMRAVMELAAAAIATTQDDVIQGSTAVDTSSTAFRAIAASVREVGSRLDEAHVAGRRIRERSGTIDERTKLLVGIAQQNLDSLTHVSDAAEQTARMAEGIGETATGLAESGTQLNAAVSRFRLAAQNPPPAGTSAGAPPASNGGGATAEPTAASAPTRVAPGRREGP